MVILWMERGRGWAMGMTMEAINQRRVALPPSGMMLMKLCVLQFCGCSVLGMIPESAAEQRRDSNFKKEKSNYGDTWIVVTPSGQKRTLEKNIVLFV